MRSRQRAHTLLGALAAALTALAPVASANPLQRLVAPCNGDCGIAVYGGHYVEDSMSDVLVGNPKPPTSWNFGGDRIIAAALSRDLWQLGRIHIEPEIGIAQRLGEQDETEFWGAFFFRYRGFPWDNRLTTTVALSTGWNYATGISELEADRNQNDGEGSRWLHFFSPEVTFALPSHPNTELLFRFHHRSGIFGLVNGAHGGNQYGTVGLRFRF